MNPVCKLLLVDNKSNDLHIWPRPMLPPPQKPQAQREKQNGAKNRPTIVHVDSCDRKRIREWQENHDPDSVDKSEDVDRKSIAAQIPFS